MIAGEAMLTKEELARNLEGTLALLGGFMRGESAPELAAKKIARTLNEMGLPYVVCGGLAVGAWGLRRTTEDVDLIMTKEDLAKFKDKWLGRGWVERFKGSRGVRDAEHNVRIDVLTTDEIPGDGKTPPFKFPHPAGIATELPGQWAGVKVIDLPNLLTLKITTGMTVPKRPGDYDDAIRLIEANRLPREFGLKLHPYVQAKYDELWQLAQAPDANPEA